MPVQHLYIIVRQKPAVVVGLQPMVEVSLVQIRTHEIFPLCLAKPLAESEINTYLTPSNQCSVITPTMFNMFLLWLGAFFRLFRNRQDLVFENFVLRQQLGVLKRRRPRPSLSIFDKLFWVAISRFWSGWKQALIVVTPGTVVRWHRAGFRLYWKLISRARRQGGRRQIPKQVRALIFRMVAENPTWGAPRIHGELLMLGFDISERTISRWMKRGPRGPGPAKRWLGLPAEPSRGDCRDGFLHRPNDHIRRALRLLRNRS
jgi:hypothetical protein